MSEKITKESVKKTSTPEKTDVIQESPTVNPKIEMDKVANPITTADDSATALLKAKLRKEIYNEMGAEEVMFMKTTLKDSKYFADLLNSSRKVVVMWELDEGEKVGALEEVTINGAMAQIPKGISVLVPEQVASMVKGYQMAEKTAGENIKNLQGGVGLKIDRDEKTRAILGV